jgi:hypothetical protein
LIVTVRTFPSRAVMTKFFDIDLLRDPRLSV